MIGPTLPSFSYRRIRREDDGRADWVDEIARDFVPQCLSSTTGQVVEDTVYDLMKASSKCNTLMILDHRQYNVPQNPLSLKGLGSLPNDLVQTLLPAIPDHAAFLH